MGSLCSKPFTPGPVQQTGQPSMSVKPQHQTPTSTDVTDVTITENRQRQPSQDEASPRGTSSMEALMSTQPASSSGATMAASCGVQTPESPSSLPLWDSTKPGQQEIVIPTPQSPSSLPPCTHPDQQEIVVPTPQSPSSLPLWDSTNPDQQEIVARSPRYKDLLKNKLDDLTEYVQLPDMWPALRALDVVDRRRRDRIMASTTEMQQVESLIVHLETGPTWRLHGFLRALAKTQQQHIIQLLGLQPADYKDPSSSGHASPSNSHLKSGAAGQTKARKAHYYKRIESNDMIQISNDLLPGLLQHCGSYNQSLMKTSLFGFKTNVPIDLTQLYVCHDASCQRNRRDKDPIGKMELFQRLFGTRCPNCLSMEGPAGAGKSSYLENYAHEWSQDVTCCEQRGSNVPCEGHSWKLVVYISSGAIRGSAVDAIKENLRCESLHKDPMMRAIDEDGDGVVVVYDAMDELRNKESIASISSYTQTSQEMMGKPKVLVAARDGLLSIERRFFDRELYLEGFSLSQGLEYMEKYFAEMYSFTKHPVLDYVKAHPQDLQWVLCNPLRVHILSELSACGFLTLQDIKHLTTVKLFDSFDRLLIERDKECRPTRYAEPAMFYQACLRCLLTDERTLSEEDVGSESPYVSLLRRHDYMGQDFNTCSNFTFPHEMLVEYFGMRGLIECLKKDTKYKRSILLYLCSEPKMRNLLQLTCGYIAQYEAQLLPDMIFIIRACLILQPQHVWCEKNEFTQGLLHLPADIQGIFPKDILTRGLTAEQARKLDDISTLIPTLFTEKAECLKAAAWFLNGYGDFGGSTINLRSSGHTWIFDFMRQLTDQQQLDVCNQTTHCMLPCTGSEMQVPPGNYGPVTVVPTSGVRWAAITESCVTEEELLYVRMYLWSPCDLSSTLSTWSHLPRVQQILHRVQQQQQQQQPYSSQCISPHPKDKLSLKDLGRIAYRIYIRGSGHTLSMFLPAEPWSEEQWILGLRELLSPGYCTGRISVNILSSPAPLSGFLSACRKLIIPGHGLALGLCIWYGYVQEDELIDFCTWAGEVGLKLKLVCLRVVLRADRGEEDWEDVDSAIRGRVEVYVDYMKGALYSPTYVTPDGKVLCEDYQPDSDRE